MRRLKRPRRPRVEGLHLHVGSYDGWFDLGVIWEAVDAKLGGYDRPDDDSSP
jgi:hypothetical protein